MQMTLVAILIDLHSLNNHGRGALRIICADFFQIAQKCLHDLLTLASVFSTDNICKQFGPKLFGSKLFDTLMIFLKQFDQVVL